MYEDLREHLSDHIYPMVGRWLEKNSSYEDELCEILQMDIDKGRHWDAKWRDYFIEIKKGRSIWLDLVRYSELILNDGPSIDSRLVTLFLIPNKEKTNVTEIICTSTQAIVNKLNLNQFIAKQIVEISNIVPRQLNAQASLTVNDIKSICEFSLIYC